MAGASNTATWRRMPGGVRHAIAASATNPLFRNVVGRLTASQLRVLGYHGVEDLDRFQAGSTGSFERSLPSTATTLRGRLRPGRSFRRTPCGSPSMMA